MSELLTKEFIFIWAGMVSISFIVWIVITAKELNGVVNKGKRKLKHTQQV